MAKTTELPDWWDQPVVQEWITTMKKPKSYRRNFIKWVNWIDMLPDEQIELRKEQLKSDDLKTQRFFEEKLKEYAREVMKQGVTKKTGDQYLIAVRSFFSHHYLNMKFKRGEIAKVLKELPEVSANNKPKSLMKNEELRAIFSVSVPRDKPLILILAQTGMSPVDVANLRIEGLDLYERDRDGKITGVKTEYVYGIKPRQKTGINQHFILGSETLRYLESLLRERGYPESGALLVTRQDNAYTSKSINERIKNLTIKALGEYRESELQTKNFRDFFMDCLRLGEVSQDIFDAMVGWKRGGASQHYIVSETVIFQTFNKVKRFFSINGDRQASEEIAKVKGEVADLYLANQALTEKMKIIEEQLRTTSMLANHFESRMDEYIDTNDRLCELLDEIFERENIAPKYATEMKEILRPKQLEPVGYGKKKN